MPLPDAISVHIDLSDMAGSNAIGKFQFTPAYINVLRDSDNNQLILPTVVEGILTAGEATVSLQPTNHPDYSPVGWAWTVTVISSDATVVQPWMIQVPYDAVGTLELQDLTPVVAPPALGSYITMADLPAAVSDVLANMATLNDAIDDRLALATILASQVSGVLADGNIPAAITRDSELTAALASYVTSSALTTTLAAYVTNTALSLLRGANNGIAELDGTGDVPLTQLGNAPVQSVAGKTGVVTLAGADIASGTVADARLTSGIQALLHHEITARMSRSTGQTISSSSATNIQATSEEKDVPGGMVNLGTNNDRITIVTAGEYVPSLVFELSASGTHATYVVEASIYKNLAGGGSTLVPRDKRLNTITNDNAPVVGTPVSMAVGDYFTYPIWQNSGGNRTLNNAILSAKYVGKS